MAGRMRGAAVVLVTLLMVSTLPLFAAAEDADLRFESGLQTTPSTGWYASGETVELRSYFVNDGASTAFENDPSCGAVLQVYDALGQTMVDDRSSCRGQTQMLDLASTEVYDFSILTWDLTDSDGVEVLPGWYSVVAFHTATGLSTAQDVHVQTDVVVPEPLQLSIEVTSRLGPLVASDEMVLSVVMSNPTGQAIALPDLGNCLLQLTMNQATQLTSSCMPSFTQIEGYEEMLIEQILLPAGSLQSGVNTIAVALPGQALAASIDLDIATPIDGFTTELQPHLELTMTGLGDGLYGDGDIMQTGMTMLNVGDETQALRFTDTCRAELWIVNDQGEVVFDSRSFKTCNAINLDYGLDSQEEVLFSLPDWTFNDLFGCQIASGHYTAVVEVPQFHLSYAQSIDYARMSSTDCAKSLDVGLTTALTGIENGFDLSVTIEPLVSEVDLRWIGPCSVSVAIINTASSEEVHRQASLCNDLDGRHVVLAYGAVGDGLVLEVGDVNMVDFSNTSLPDGTYQMVVTLEANPTTSAGFVFEWPIVETVSAEPVIIEEQPAAESSRLISGTWSGVLTEQGTCWIIETPQEGQLLLSKAALGSWMPQQGWTGTYDAVSTDAAPACAMFQAPSIELLSIETEAAPAAPAQSEEAAKETILQSSDEPLIAIAPTLIMVVTTTSLLSLLVTIVLGNESIRIPSTAAGLWFLGMVGRTHETTDGRYQRGRLMGYLTANPGCHFRALMAALDMSNGQITHHLRILENEEVIWRRKDGRLVRYYPLTNTMSPAMSEEELPVPPLSPDPNSLQGKILTLLDADGPMGEFPTQAELAKRLEKSQQLVSHHLRTLQKFGLVEKRKMGIKNRYKLTREAIFLLETNDDFSRD
ncbi:ArsR family transcriptional regulator [Euryarchaeota archaeon]|nr:ArsR family transcriptional regulator [Euryarchaeota archaeon]